jgi:hypothetical protein
MFGEQPPGFVPPDAAEGRSLSSELTNGNPGAVEGLTPESTFPGAPESTATPVPAEKPLFNDRGTVNWPNGINAQDMPRFTPEQRNIQETWQREFDLVTNAFSDAVDRVKRANGGTLSESSQQNIEQLRGFLEDVRAMITQLMENNIGFGSRVEQQALHNTLVTVIDETEFPNRDANRHEVIINYEVVLPAITYLKTLLLQPAQPTVRT